MNAIVALRGFHCRRCRSGNALSHSTRQRARWKGELSNVHGVSHGHSMVPWRIGADQMQPDRGIDLLGFGRDKSRRGLFTPPDFLCQGTQFEVRNTVVHRMLCHCHSHVINVFPRQLPADEQSNKIPPARKAESQVQSQASVSRICRSRNGGHARCWSRGYPRRIHSLRLNGSVSTNAETGSTLEKIWR